MRKRYVLLDPVGEREALRPLFERLWRVRGMIHPGRPGFWAAERAIEGLNDLARELTGEPFTRPATDGAALQSGPSGVKRAD